MSSSLVSSKHPSEKLPFGAIRKAKRSLLLLARRRKSSSAVFLLFPAAFSGEKQDQSLLHRLFVQHPEDNAHEIRIEGSKDLPAKGIKVFAVRETHISR